MSFDEPFFIYIFLPVLILGCALSDRFRRGKKALLLTASVFFYAFSSLADVPVLAFSVLFNWAVGIRLDALRETGRDRGRKILLALSVLINAALLCFFKYPRLLMQTLFGPTASGMPAGISFFTFQGISYIVDVSRGQKPAKKLSTFALYMAFFPQLLMGPIIRYADVADRLEAPSARAEDLAAGLRRFVLGLAKKVLIAGQLAGAVDAVFSAVPAGWAAAVDFRSAWIAGIAYTLQLYFDFSGYSDMALGLGRVFGFTYPENFDFPLASSSVREFWRRWHISLSSWFRDYVYIPLGGSRHGKARASANRMVVFLLTGIWHGAGWTFVLWGLLHGLLVNLESLGVIPSDKLNKKPAGHLVCRLMTMLAVMLLFVLFRADSLHDALVVLASLFAGFDAAGWSTFANEYVTPLFLTVLVTALLCSGGLYTGLRARVSGRLAASPGAAAAARVTCSILCLPLLVLCLIALSGGSFTPFIYAQF